LSRKKGRPGEERDPPQGIFCKTTSKLGLLKGGKGVKNLKTTTTKKEIDFPRSLGEQKERWTLVVKTRGRSCEKVSLTTWGYDV